MNDDILLPPGNSSERLVSVVMTSYNYARYLRDAIESVLNQTYRTLELIIVDDGSTDESHAIIHEYAGLKPDRIRAITRTENWGLTRSWNQGLELVSGEILAGISSDDAWRPNAIETWVRFFEANPAVDLLSTDFDLIGADGTALTGWDKLELVPQFTRYFGADFGNLYVELLRGNFIPDAAVVVSLARLRAEDLRYDELCPLVSDWELYVRLAKRRTWHYLPEATVFYRWHGNNLSAPQQSLEAQQQVLGQHVYVLAKALASAHTDEHRTVTLQQLGRFWIDYTAKLLEAGVPNVAELPQTAAAHELQHLRQRTALLEAERDKQRARAEALERRFGLSRARTLIKRAAQRLGAIRRT